MYKIFYDSCTHRTAFTKKSINDLHLMTGFQNVKTDYFKLPLHLHGTIILFQIHFQN